MATSPEIAEKNFDVLNAQLDAQKELERELNGNATSVEQKKEITEGESFEEKLENAYEKVVAACKKGSSKYFRKGNFNEILGIDLSRSSREKIQEANKIFDELITQGKFVEAPGWRGAYIPVSLMKQPASKPENKVVQKIEEEAEEPHVEVEKIEPLSPEPIVEEMNKIRDPMHPDNKNGHRAQSLVGEKDTATVSDSDSQPESQNDTDEEPSFENVYLESEFTIDGTLFKLGDRVYAPMQSGELEKNAFILKCPKSISDVITVKNILTNRVETYDQEEFFEWQRERFDGAPDEAVETPLSDEEVGIQSADIEEKLKKEEAPLNQEVQELVTAQTLEAVEPPSVPNEVQIEYLTGVEKEISEARSTYAALLVQWKNKNRAQKGKFAKVLSDLGVEKQMPELAKSPELIEAEKYYRQAKRKKLQFIADKGDITINRKKTIHGEFDIPIAETTEKIIFTVRENLVEEVEHEQEQLWKLVNAPNSPVEKGKFAKTLEWINKKPLWQRAAATSALLTTAGLLFGSIGLAGAATYAGMRTVRSIAGTTAGMAAGKYVDGVFKKANKESREQVLDRYVANLQTGFEEKQEEQDEKLAKYFDTEERMKKLQRTVKTATIIGVAGATNWGMGYEMQHHLPGVTQDLGIAENIKEKIFGHGHTVPAHNVHVAKHAMETAPKATASIEHPHVVSVDLDKHGFIRTFDDLKKQLSHQYPDKVPEQYKHFMDTPSDKLAQEFGLYDPAKHLSGTGLKGDFLSLDEKGLHYESGIDGHVMDIDKTHTFESQGGKMFRAKPAITHAEVAQATPVTAVSVEHQIDGDATGGDVSPMHPDQLGADNYGDTESVPTDGHDMSVLGDQQSDAFPQGSVVPDTHPINTTTLADKIEVIDTGSVPIPAHPEFASIIKSASLEKMAHIVPGHAFNFDHGSAHLDILDTEGTRNLVIAGSVKGVSVEHPIAVAEEVDLGNGARIWSLNDGPFQESGHFKDLRRAFTHVLNQDIEAKHLAGHIVGKKGIPFDGGIIHIMQNAGNNDNAYDVLLNGKKIATGNIGMGHSTVKMLDTLSKHHHWWQAETVYEKAFDKAQSTLRHLAKGTKIK